MPSGQISWFRSQESRTISDTNIGQDFHCHVIFANANAKDDGQELEKFPCLQTTYIQLDRMATKIIRTKRLQVLRLPLRLKGRTRTATLILSVNMAMAVVSFIHNFFFEKVGPLYKTNNKNSNQFHNKMPRFFISLISRFVSLLTFFIGRGRTEVRVERSAVFPSGLPEPH